MRSSVARARSSLIALWVLSCGVSEAPRTDSGADDGATSDAGLGSDAGASDAAADGGARREGIALLDVTAASGDMADAYSTRDNRWSGLDIYTGAVAFMDLDGDALADVVLARTSMSEPEHQGLRFFRGRGDGVFDDVTEAVGLAGERARVTGLAVADLDGDGRRDLFVGTDGDGDRLYLQTSPGRFVESALGAGVRGERRRSRSIALLDYDADGWLDLYVTAWDDAGPDGHHGGAGSWRAPNALYRNRGDATFEDVTDRAGDVACFGRSSLGVGAADLDGDTDVDLYVANDFFDDCLLENLGDGTFRDVSEAAGVGPHAINGMGVAIGDADGDGDLDLYVTDDERPDESTGNAFYRNAGGLRFESVAQQIGADGLIDTGQSVAIYWGAGFVDVDGDGALELHVAQQETGPDRLLRWDGERYAAVAAERFEVLSDVRGSAYADFDSDGDLDMVLAARGGSPRLLENVGGAGQRVVAIDVRGPVGNPDALGAVVTVEACGHSWVRSLESSVGYLSASEPLGAVGVGACAEPARVEVRFVGGDHASAEETLGEPVVLLAP